jgi:DNA-binding beta-propeller fold protein YncE
MRSLYESRRRLALVLSVAVLAGCTSSATSAHASGTSTVGRGLTSPGCSTATAAAPAMRGVRTAMLPTTGGPFGVSVTPEGKWAFVSGSASSVIQLFRISGGSLAPVATGSVPLPASPLGSTMTADGRYLLAAAGSGAVVIDVARAVSGKGRAAVLGTLSDPKLVARQGSAIEVAVSPDGDYAFVTNEYADLAAVFNLHRALTQGFGPDDYVGSVPLGQAAVGMAVSPDGRWLYATSEVVSPRTNTGTLTVINLRRAETDPAASVVATVDAGCQPVRVVASATTVWVDARASDDLLGFSAARLLSDPAQALLSITRVGEAPVGLALVRGGSLIVTANSNRFDQPGATANLSVVDVQSSKPAVLGYVPAGQFPRDMAVEPGGSTVLIANFASGQLEAVNLAALR